MMKSITKNKYNFQQKMTQGHLEQVYGWWHIVHIEKLIE